MNKKVTYSDIVNALSRKTGFSKQKTEAFVKTLLSQVKDELKESGKASITNFGSFKVKDVAEREGKNPQTGEPIVIPAHKRVSFSPYKSLREDVNAEYGHLESELIGEDETSSDESTAEPRKESEAIEEKRAEENEEVSEQELEVTEDATASEDVESEPEVLTTEEFDTQEAPDAEIADSEPEADSTSEQAAKSSKTEDEKEESPTSNLVISEPQRTKEKNYTNLLALLAVLMLTIIAISSVWLLLDNGSRESQQSQRAVQNSAMVDGQQVAQTGAYRSYEEIKREADALEVRVRQLEQEEQRIRAVVRATPKQEDVTQAGDPEEASGNSEDVTESVGRDTQSMESYQIQEGEWYWAIAKKLYGQPRFWPLLFMENHTVSEDPDSLLKLININVPNIEGTATNPSKQDYKDLAAATQMVAQAYENAGKTDKANEYSNIARMWEQMGS